jgi:hypothetical protein
MVRKIVLINVLLLSMAVISYGGQIVTGSITDPTALIMYADPNSREVYSNGAMVTESSAGRWHLTQKQPVTELNCDGCLVMAFKLPERPEGKLIQARSLMFFVYEIYNSRVDRIDLYGVGSISGSQGVTADTYYLGDWGWDENAVALDKGMIALETAAAEYWNTWRGTDSDGALRLSCWLNSLYDNGAVAGDYALLRLNANYRYNVYTRIKIGNVNTTNNDNVRIYYDFVDQLSEPCPNPIIPERKFTIELAGDLYPNFAPNDPNDVWLGGDGKITFEDMAALADNWLNCERVPQRLCD